MIVTEETQSGLLTGQRNAEMDAASRQREIMANQSVSFFSDVIPAAFRLDNEIGSAIVSKSIEHISDKYDESYFSAGDVGEFANTPHARQLVLAKNPAHMQAM